MQLRPLTIADYDAVHALWSSCEGVGLNESDSETAVAAYLRRNPGMSFVATDGTGAIVGAVLCGHEGRRGYLHHLAVARHARKQGIGKALVEACFARLAEEGILRCNIFLYADNAAGEVFWVHNGWSVRADLKVLQRKV